VAPGAGRAASVPSRLVASHDDPLGDFDNVLALGRQWGSLAVDGGPIGHLNAASGFGEWPEALDHLHALGLAREALLPEAGAHAWH
jgi:predicted alpha/beta hydrolase family esterase